MGRTRIMAVAALAVGLWAGMGTGAARADVLDKIKQRGEIVVGVKPDYRPFGYRDPSGALVGLEPDLAADVAAKLGVKLVLEPVNAANRMDFLKQGKIDLIIATLSDKPERRKVVQFVEPLYYSDFVNVLLSKKSGITRWEDLKDKPVCGTTAAFYNKDVAARYGAQIIGFDGSEKPLLALKQGNCLGYLFDQTFIVGKLLDDEWKADYAMPLPGITETPWAIAVAPGEDALAKVVSDLTIEWFRSGRIVDLEKKWGVPPTSYAARMHEQYSHAGK